MVLTRAWFREEMIVLGPAFFRTWFLPLRAMGNEVVGDDFEHGIQQSGHQGDGLGAVPAHRYGEPDMAQCHACGKRVEFLLGAALGALGWLLPGNQPIVWDEEGQNVTCPVKRR